LPPSKLLKQTTTKIRWGIEEIAKGQKRKKPRRWPGITAC
jgi:hypothetical protein